MNIAKSCAFSFVLFFLSAPLAFAAFEITEVMYDTSGSDTNREWIEVQNTGSSSDDLSKWYFFSDNSKHTITPTGVSLVPAGSYAVIAQNPATFRADWPSFSGLLFDSSWTGFNNKGESIALKDPSAAITSSTTFNSGQGGAGNGDSLQKISDAWLGSKPTPGAENKIVTPIIKKEPIPAVSKNTAAKETVPKSQVTKKESSISNSSVKPKDESKDIINLNTLEASAAESDASKSANADISTKTLAYSGLALVIIIGSLSIFLIRKKNHAVNSKEKALTADDMTLEE